MKSKLFGILLAAVSFLLVNTLFAQEADAIIGTYMTEGGKAKVVIEKEGEAYFGTLVWSSTPGKLDDKNPDPEKRNNLLAGTVIVKNLTFNNKKGWSGGTIYDPESGKTYSAKASRTENGDLNLRGFLGVSLLGRTSTWTRVTEE